MLTSLVGQSLSAVIPSYTMRWLSRCFNCRLETVWSFKTVMHLALLGHRQESGRLRPCRCETLSFVLEHLPFLRYFKTYFFNSFCCIFIEGISWWRYPFPILLLNRDVSEIFMVQRGSRIKVHASPLADLHFCCLLCDIVSWCQVFFLKCLIFNFNFVVCIFFCLLSSVRFLFFF